MVLVLVLVRTESGAEVQDRGVTRAGPVTVREMIFHTALEGRREAGEGAVIWGRVQIGGVQWVATIAEEQAAAIEIEIEAVTGTGRTREQRLAYEREIEDITAQTRATTGIGTEIGIEKEIEKETGMWRSPGTSRTRGRGCRVSTAREVEPQT